MKDFLLLFSEIFFNNFFNKEKEKTDFLMCLENYKIWAPAYPWGINAISENNSQGMFVSVQ